METTTTVEITESQRVQLIGILSVRQAYCEAEIENCRRLDTDPTYWLQEHGEATDLLEAF